MEQSSLQHVLQSEVSKWQGFKSWDIVDAILMAKCGELMVFDRINAFIITNGFLRFRS